MTREERLGALRIEARGDFAWYWIEFERVWREYGTCDDGIRRRVHILHDELDARLTLALKRIDRRAKRRRSH